MYINIIRIYFEARWLENGFASSKSIGQCVETVLIIVDILHISMSWKHFTLLLYTNSSLRKYDTQQFWSEEKYSLSKLLNVYTCKSNLLYKIWTEINLMFLHSFSTRVHNFVANVYTSIFSSKKFELLWNHPNIVLITLLHPTNMKPVI